MKDKQGILRGQCTVCECTEYDVSSRGRIKCEACGHVPTKHKKIEDNSSDSDGDSHYVNSVDLVSASFDGLASNLGQQPPVQQACSDKDVESDGVSHKGNNSSGISVTTCQIPGCTKMASYNLNTGQYNSIYCFNHMSVIPTTSQLNNTALTSAPLATVGVS